MQISCVECTHSRDSSRYPDVVVPQLPLLLQVSVLAAHLTIVTDGVHVIELDTVEFVLLAPTFRAGE